LFFSQKKKVILF